jgi:hypothetical protein
MASRSLARSEKITGAVAELRNAKRAGKKMAEQGKNVRIAKEKVRG